MLIKYLIFFYLLSQVNCYLINRIIINKKNVIIKETYNGKFVENYKYSNKYNKKNFKLKDYNLYFDK
jgi:hypothetical protein